MLGKRSWPAVGKLARPLRSGLVDSATSPRSPLECSMPSPKCLKSYDQGGVGLGIVVALDKSNKNITVSGGGGEIFLARYAISGQFSTRSSPIPVGSPVEAKANQMREALDEEFTYVTCHGPNKSVTTRVYYDRGDQYGTITGHNRIDLRGGVGSELGVFKISPARLFDDQCSYGADSDFLSSCHSCRKGLHGKDIYMYRGEKAFCSAECRQRQIAIDERKEHCRSKISRSNDVVSSSPCCTGGQIFSTGIIAV